MVKAKVPFARAERPESSARRVGTAVACADPHVSAAPHPRRHSGEGRNPALRACVRRDIDREAAILQRW